MKKLIIFTILITSLVLTGCAVKKGVEVGKDNQNKNTENTASENTQIANPASTYCIEQGGSSAIIETEAGQAGICKFDDGSECDEWAFFRKECKQGDGTKTEIPIGASIDLDINGWKTYEDEKYGFEIKYPKEWEKYGGARVDICTPGKPGDSSNALVQFSDTGCEIDFMDVVNLENGKCANILFVSPGFNYDWGKCKNLLNSINEEKRSVSIPSAVSAWLKTSEIPDEAKGGYKVFEKILSTFKFTN